MMVPVDFNGHVTPRLEEETTIEEFCTGVAIEMGTKIKACEACIGKYCQGMSDTHWVIKILWTLIEAL